MVCKLCVLASHCLQVQSQTMSTKLRNRRAVEDKLGGFLEQVVVSEDLISSVLDSEVRRHTCWHSPRHT